MKDKAVRGKLIRQSVIVLITLALAGGVLFFVSSQDDAYTQEMNDLQSQTDKVLRDMSTLRDQYERVDQSAEMYKEIEAKNAKNALRLNRVFLRDAFNQLRKQYNLGNVKITMSVPTQPEGAQYKRDSGNVEVSNVEVSFESISDENVFYVVSALEKEITGIQFNVLSATQNRSVDATALQEVSQRGVYPMVKSELSFVWYGINTATEEERAANAPITATGTAPAAAPKAAAPRPAAPARKNRR